VQDIFVHLESIMDEDSEATIPFTNHHWKYNDTAKYVYEVVTDFVRDIKKSGINEALQSAISWYFTFNGFRVTNQIDT